MIDQWKLKIQRPPKENGNITDSLPLSRRHPIEQHVLTEIDHCKSPTHHAETSWPPTRPVVFGSVLRASHACMETKNIASYYYFSVFINGPNYNPKKTSHISTSKCQASSGHGETLPTAPNLVTSRISIADGSFALHFLELFRLLRPHWHYLNLEQNLHQWVVK